MIKNSGPNDDNQVEREFYEISKIISFKSVDQIRKQEQQEQTLPKSVPATIEFNNIIKLNLSCSNVEQLPDKLCLFKNLQVLDLSKNELDDLPYSCTKLKRLQQLDISVNKFKSIPKCIAHGMGTLKILNISKNPNIKMNIIPFSNYLEKFYASDNGCCDNFPDWLLSSKFFNIREFCLDRTKFEVFNFVGVKKDIYLNSISLACSNLSNSVLSMMLENVVHIENINVGNEDFCNSENSFSTIPIEILKNPHFIKELNFHHTGLPSVPQMINRLSKLKKLDLGKNHISWFPEEICELKELESLIIEGNSFLLLPKNIGNLKLLTELRAENNCISELPQSFANLSNLKYCDLYNNLFKEFPKVLLEIKSLEGLDIEMNFFWTDYMDDKDAYLSLKNSYATYLSNNNKDVNRVERLTGAKLEPDVLDNNDSDRAIEYSSSSVTSDSEPEKSEFDEFKSKDNEENWDAKSDSDDNFEPENQETEYYSERFKKFIQPTSIGFCPADLHSKRVKSEVAYMRTNGSLPSFKLEEGQFDDP